MINELTGRFGTSVLLYTGILSAVFAVTAAIGTAALLRFIITADENFFLRLQEKIASAHRIKALFLIRNAVGLLMLLSGLLMLVLPGQGLLTILLSLLFLEFPGRQKLFFFLLSSEKVQTALNRLRKKWGKKEFNFKKSL